MTTITIEIDDKSIDGKRFMSFLKTLGYVSIVSKKSNRKGDENRLTKNEKYTASDFLNEWSGAFSQLNDMDLDKIKYEYLSQKYK